MKTKIEVQFMNKDVNVTDIEKLVKEDIKEKGIKLNTLETLEVYYKPEDSAVYYVATTKDKKVYGVNNDPLLFNVKEAFIGPFLVSCCIIKKKRRIRL